MNVQFDAEEMGKRIESYRKQCGLTKEELAERAQISREIVDHYETSAQVVDLYTIIRIANALNIEPYWLLAWKLEDEE